MDWPVHSDNAIRVTGYVLEADLHEQGVFVEIWDGRQHPEFTDFVYHNVTQGQLYSFRYKVLNLNGESEYSNILSTFACELPSAPSTP